MLFERTCWIWTCLVYFPDNFTPQNVLWPTTKNQRKAIVKPKAENTKLSTLSTAWLGPVVSSPPYSLPEALTVVSPVSPSSLISPEGFLGTYHRSRATGQGLGGSPAKLPLRSSCHSFYRGPYPRDSQPALDRSKLTSSWDGQSPQSVLHAV